MLAQIFVANHPILTPLLGLLQNMVMGMRWQVSSGCALRTDSPFIELLGIRADGLLSAASICLAHVAVLYLGPLTMAALDSWQTGSSSLFRQHPGHCRPVLPMLRDMVVAPVFEEFVFRACMLPLLLGQAGRLASCTYHTCGCPALLSR